MPRSLRFLAYGICLITVICARGSAADPAVRFETDVRPILKANCFQCHGEEEKPKGGLDLRLVRSIVNGGDSGPAVTPGKPDGSLLYQRLVAGEMPPGKKKLSAPAPRAPAAVD